jgi:hypothetical protein
VRWLAGRLKRTEIPVSEIASALGDLAAVVRAASSSWALVGGHALRVHGVPRDTLDIDAFVEEAHLESLACDLVAEHDWIPLRHDARTNRYALVGEATVHRMDDPVLFDVGAERCMVPLASREGVVVELLAAQHPVEREMIDEACVRLYCERRVPVAPLGGVLLVKAKADRRKDRGAIDQAAEHLGRSVLEAAVAWASGRDPATAEDLAIQIHEVLHRRTPTRTNPASRARRATGPATVVPPSALPASRRRTTAAARGPSTR